MDNEERKRLSEIFLSLEEVSKKISLQEIRHSAMKEDLDSLLSVHHINNLKNAVYEEGKRIENELLNKSDSKFAAFKKVTAVISFVVVIAGVFGISGMINNAVDTQFKEKIDQKIKIKLDESAAKINKFIEESKEDIQTNSNIIKETLEDVFTYNQKFDTHDLIVLQTDLGSSGDMGNLFGAIYHSNPRALVQVTANEISNYNVTEASWTLNKSSKLFPENTIFVALTGDPGDELKNPLIVRTKNNFTLVGYSNGVFADIQKDNHDTTHQVSWDKFVEYIQSEKGKKIKTNEKPSATEILGTLAGYLSRYKKPWDKDNKIWNKVASESKTPIMQKSVDNSVKYNTSQNALIGKVMKIDRYGNAITNITSADIEKFLSKNNKIPSSDSVKIIHNIDVKVTRKSKEGDTSFTYTARLVENFSGINKGVDVALLDSKTLKLATSYGNFSTSRVVKPSDTIKITKLIAKKTE